MTKSLIVGVIGSWPPQMIVKHVEELPDDAMPMRVIGEQEFWIMPQAEHDFAALRIAFGNEPHWSLDPSYHWNRKSK